MLIHSNIAFFVFLFIALCSLCTIHNKPLPTPLSDRRGGGGGTGIYVLPVHVYVFISMVMF